MTGREERREEEIEAKCYLLKAPGLFRFFLIKYSPR
jgi:hypothetical protein